MRIHLYSEYRKTTGAGHLARMSALYDAFAERGFEPLLVLDSPGLPDWLAGGRKLLLQDWARRPEALEAPDIAVVDSYLAPLPAYQALSRRAKVCAYFDDERRLDYPEGRIVNAAWDSGALYPEKDRERLLSGVAYQPLRPGFVRREPKEIRAEAEDILVSFGGAGTWEMAESAALALREAAPRARLHLLLSDEQAARARPGAACLVHHGLDPKALRALMDRCDLALTAGGQLLTELAAARVPAIAFLLAENQRPNVEGWARAGAVLSAGNWDAPDRLLQLKERFREASAREKRAAMSAAAQALDADGAARIARALLQDLVARGLVLRPAREDDRRPVFELSNDPLVRSMSYVPEAIPWERHCAWFDKTLADPDILFLVAEAGGLLAGQVRYARTGASAWVALSVSPRFRGLGTGEAVLKASIEPMRRRFPGVARVDAHIKLLNKASLRVFEKAGYAPAGPEGARPGSALYRFVIE